ncbi:unnamed protein product [Ixodes pacificus]
MAGSDHGLPFVPSDRRRGFRGSVTLRPALQQARSWVPGQDTVLRVQCESWLPGMRKDRRVAAILEARQLFQSTKKRCLNKPFSFPRGHWGTLTFSLGRLSNTTSTPSRKRDLFLENRCTAAFLCSCACPFDSSRHNMYDRTKQHELRREINRDNRI